MTKNVALYLRKSREDEELKEETLSRHETMLTEYCARHSLNIVKVYREVVSGENIANRPEMLRLLDDVSSGLYDGVVCIEIERLSRGNPVDQMEILDVFKGSHTLIYTLNKTYDLNNEEIDEEYFEFALFMSRREYKTIKRRLLRGRMHAAEEGLYTCSQAPYGYDRQKTEKGFTLSPNEKESAVVRFIFSEYVKGVGAYVIANKLNEQGTKTKKGHSWTAPLIIRMIQNKIYIGFIHIWKYNKWVEGKHPGIIDPEVFERAQQLHSTKSPTVRAKYTTQNPLAGLVRCGECGRIMQRTARRSQGYEYLTCVNPSCSVHRSVRLDKVEPLVLKELKTAFEGFNYFLDVPPVEDHGEELEMLQNELTAKQSQFERACEMLEQGIYSIERFKTRSTAIQKEIETISARIEDLENTPQDDQRAQKAIPILEKVLDQYDTLNRTAKNDLLRAIIKKITITPADDGFSLDLDLLL